MQAIPVRGNSKEFIRFKILIVGSGSTFCVLLSEHAEHFKVFLDLVVPIKLEFSKVFDRCYFFLEVVLLVIGDIGNGK